MTTQTTAYGTTTTICGNSGMLLDGEPPLSLPTPPLPTPNSPPPSQTSLSDQLTDWPIVWTYWAAGAVGDELRYSIRSFLAHHPDARVIVIGDRPDWYSGEYIQCPRLSRRPHQAFRDCYHKLLTAAKSFDQFIWHMDDIYWIRPFTIQQAATPKYVRHVSQQRYAAWQPGNAWARTRAAAYEHLLARNLPTYDFASHLPQPIIAESFLANEEELQLSQNYKNWECIYYNRHMSNIAEDWGRRYRRINKPVEQLDPKESDMLLNHCHSCFKGGVLRFLQETFPQPCKVEQ